MHVSRPGPSPWCHQAGTFTQVPSFSPGSGWTAGGRAGSWSAVLAIKGPLAAPFRKTSTHRFTPGHHKFLDTTVP